MNDERLTLAHSLEQASAAADLAANTCKGYAWTGSTPEWARLSNSTQLAVVSAGAAVSFLNALAEYERCLEEVHARAAACKHVTPLASAIPVLFAVPLLARELGSPRRGDALRRLASQIFPKILIEINISACDEVQPSAYLAVFRQLNLASPLLAGTTITLGVHGAEFSRLLQQASIILMVERTVLPEFGRECSEPDR